jgi:D-glycerate 3-kinase
MEAAYFAFARTGPLFRTLSSVPPPVDWLKHGESLAKQLTNSNTVTKETNLLQDTTLASRIFHYYLPVFFWCRNVVVETRKAYPNKAVGIGLSAPQGCGKTTLVNLLTGCFEAEGLVCAAVSFDDFYLTGAEQDDLANANQSNPLLQVRGNAGTHDIELGANTLRSLITRECNVPIPRYDKSARNGRGDRGDRSTWTVQTNSADVILLEGWMAGFEPTEVVSNKIDKLVKVEDMKDGEDAEDTRGGGDEKKSNNIDIELKGIEEVNKFMGKYSVWHDQMDSWVVVGIDDVNYVYSWRLQAEHEMIKSGKNGMTDEQVSDFVSRYMPAYKTYLPNLYESCNNGGVGGKPTLMIKVGSERQVL